MIEAGIESVVGGPVVVAGVEGEEGTGRCVT